MYAGPVPLPEPRLLASVVHVVVVLPVLLPPSVVVVARRPGPRASPARPRRPVPRVPTRRRSALSARRPPADLTNPNARPRPAPPPLLLLGRARGGSAPPRRSPAHPAVAVAVAVVTVLAESPQRPTEGEGAGALPRASGVGEGTFGPEGRDTQRSPEACRGLRSRGPSRRF